MVILLDFCQSDRREIVQYTFFIFFFLKGKLDLLSLVPFAFLFLWVFSSQFLPVFRGLLFFSFLEILYIGTLTLSLSCKLQTLNSRLSFFFWFWFFFYFVEDSIGWLFIILCGQVCQYFILLHLDFYKSDALVTELCELCIWIFSHS